jgi:hypothetical protein
MTAINKPAGASVELAAGTMAELWAG